jgi:hypothetical protein
VTPSISARQAARHLRALVGVGMTVPQISVASGVAVRVVQDVVAGRQDRVLRATAERLLAVTNPTPGPPGSMPSIGVLRRIQGLLAMGWRHRDLDLRTGMNTRLLLDRGHGWIPPEIYADVCRVYDQLSMTPGPCARTRDTARAGGYAPPLAWDDETIDDPRVLPNLHGDGQDVGVDEAAVLRRIAGDHVPVTPAEAAEVVARMRRAGLSDAHIARVTRLRAERYAPLRRDLNRAA